MFGMKALVFCAHCSASFEIRSIVKPITKFVLPLNLNCERQQTFVVRIFAVIIIKTVFLWLAYQSCSLPSKECIFILWAIWYTVVKSSPKSGSAPCSSNSLTVEAFPFIAATCNAVHPNMCLALISIWKIFKSLLISWSFPSCAALSNLWVSKLVKQKSDTRIHNTIHLDR